MKSILVGLLSGLVMFSAQAASKEQQAYCKGMAAIAGASAEMYTTEHKTTDDIQAWVYQLIFELKMDKQAAAQAYAAADFGIKMSAHYIPGAIAYYQYQGCLATI